MKVRVRTEEVLAIVLGFLACLRHAVEKTETNHGPKNVCQIRVTAPNTRPKENITVVLPHSTAFSAEKHASNNKSPRITRCVGSLRYYWVNFPQNLFVKEVK